MDEARRPLAGWLLGFAAGGFFDGVVLHQVLQWHHLLSGLQGEAWRDLRLQVLADGLFHALMYLVALAGLWRLQRERGRWQRAGAGRRLLAELLIGFGTWHALDAVVSHWLLGIHRIRMDAEEPLLWDIGWLLVFGLVPAAVGWLLARRGPSGGVPLHGQHGGMLPAALLGLAVVAAGAAAARPPPGSDASAVTVVLRPGVPPHQLLDALAGGDSRIVWSDGAVWLLRLDPRLSRWRLYASGGALHVSGTLLPAGCSAWLRPAVRRTELQLGRVDAARGSANRP